MCVCVCIDYTLLWKIVINNNNNDVVRCACVIMLLFWWGIIFLYNVVWIYNTNNIPVCKYLHIIPGTEEHVKCKIIETDANAAVVLRPVVYNQPPDNSSSTQETR